MVSGEQDILDKLAAEYGIREIKDSGRFYGSEGELIQLVQNWLARHRTAWKKPKRCSFAGCEQPSIRSSHTIQRSGPLASIAVKGHVISPKYDGKGNVIIKLIGLKDASVFPGFCGEHERLFREFEDTKVIKNDRHALLQAFRGICRESFRLKQEAEFTFHIIEELRRRKNQYIWDKYGENFIWNRTEDKLDNALLSLANERQAAYVTINSGIYIEFVTAIKGGTKEVAIRTIDLPFKVPLCLSGVSRTQVKTEEGTESTHIFFVVVPNGNGTKIILSSAFAQQHILDAYVEQRLSTPSSVLDAVEAILANNTDHWFLHPTVWDALDTERKEAIRERVKAEGAELGYDPRVPIFDALRNNLATSPELDSLILRRC